MQIIDTHTHYFPDELAQRAIDRIRESVPFMSNHTDGTLAGLKRSMKNSGIFKSITLPVATKPTQVRVINNGVIELNDNSIIPFGALHPNFSDFEQEISRLKKRGIKGIKLHPEYQNFKVDDPKMYPIYDALSSSEMIVIFHAGKDPWPVFGKGGYPKRFVNMLDNFPRLKTVAAHLGGWKKWDEVFEILAGRELYFDTAAIIKYVSKDTFMKIATKHGFNKILFGTDSPWLDSKAVINYIDDMPISAKEKEMIFSSNAKMLLGL